MATYQDVLLSILSMDTYNRGYGTGMADGINLDAGAGLLHNLLTSNS